MAPFSFVDESIDQQNAFAAQDGHAYTIAAHDHAYSFGELAVFETARATRQLWPVCNHCSHWCTISPMTAKAELLSQGWRRPRAAFV